MKRRPDASPSRGGLSWPHTLPSEDGITWPLQSADGMARSDTGAGGNPGYRGIAHGEGACVVVVKSCDVGASSRGMKRVSQVPPPPRSTSTG